MPAIAMGVAAPAYAASTDSYAPTICNLFYAAGTSINFQGLQMFLGVESSGSTIPAGTEFTWTVTMSGNANNQVPTLNYSQNARWSLGVSPAPGTVAPSFQVRLRVLNSAVTPAELNCVPALIWNGSASIYPGSTVSIQGGTTMPGTGQGQGLSSSLSFTVAKRYPSSVNAAGRRPHEYLSKSGTQTCYPAIKYVMTAASKGSTCGNDGNDTSTVYPSVGCKKIAGTTADQGSQLILPPVC